MRALPWLLVACGFLISIGCSVEPEVVQKNGRGRVAIPNVGDVQQSDATPLADRQVIEIIPGEVTRTLCEPTVIDTSKFAKQVWRTGRYEGPIRESEGFGGDDAAAPQIELAESNGMTVDGGLSDYARVHAKSRFPGIDQSFFTPPDPTLAVGPNHVVEMVNSEMAFFSKSGEVQFQTALGSQGNPGFFEEVGSEDFCIDPRCFYDHFEDRFVILCLEVYFDTVESFLTIAVSDDDDPNGIWFRYRTPATFQIGGQLNFDDYPSFAFDDSGYYISGNLFNISTFAFNGIGFRTMEKSPLLSGQPMTFNDRISNSDGLISVQMAQTFDVAGASPIGISMNSQTSARLVTLDDPFGNLNVITTDVSVPFFNFANSASNNGGEASTVDSRAMNLHRRGNQLFSCHSTGLGSRNVARWYEFALNGFPNGANPSLTQSGEINLGPQQETFFPSIYSNQNGDVAMVYANSSPNEFISVNVSARRASDPPGTMSEMMQFEVGSVSATGRFGDYFDIALDPADDLTFWIVGETMEDFGWDTVVNSFSVDLVGDVNCDGSIDLLDVTPFIDLLASGEFSFKADINGDGNVNLLDVTPFVELLSDN